MSTIAYRDGVMASDSQINGDGINEGFAEKIVRNPQGDLMGLVGDYAFFMTFKSWFLGGEREPQPACKQDNFSCCVFIIRSDTPGVITIIEPAGNLQFKAPYYAAGSGREIALGAFAIGATSEKAVEAAILHDNSSGGPVVTLTHTGDEK